MTAADLIKALGGRNGTARCPVHEDRTPSLSVSEMDGKLLVHCHAGCSQSDVWSALQDRGLTNHGRTSRRREVSQSQRATSIPNHRAAALAIWEASGSALHSPAQAYLQCRGIVIQPPTCLRYHPGINAMVALVQASDGRMSGVQRVYLTTDRYGTWKQGRYSLGPVKGGAVRLTPAAETLHLTESVEDGLAFRQMTGKPTWAVPGAGFMQSFKAPPEVRELVLAPDNDTAGLAAIEATIKASPETNLQLRRLLPPPGLDWCDLLDTLEERIAIEEEPASARTWVEEFVDGV